LPLDGDLLGNHEPALYTVIPREEGGRWRYEGSATLLASKLKRRCYSLPGWLTAGGQRERERESGGEGRGSIDPAGDVALLERIFEARSASPVPRYRDRMQISDNSVLNTALRGPVKGGTLLITRAITFSL